MSRHSARNVPLNDSQKALSVGLPGREKSIFTRCYGKPTDPSVWPVNSLPLSQNKHLRCSTFLLQAIQHAYHIFSSQALTYFDGQALPRVNIDDGQ